MNSRTIDVVTGWETVAAPGGYEGLRQLADAEFSGAVSAGTAWAFLLNGRIVGVFEGEIGEFEDADATAYRAAHPSLPLLFAMQERGGETRANYYTNETPLQEVDRTLEGGGFTGYVELSENVLSGDYYVVYHGGKSMSAAFVGSSERLVTGEEAFETAANEVGIYDVVDVDIELVDIPEPEPPAEEEDDSADADSAGAAAAAGTAGGTDADASDTTAPEPREESAGDGYANPPDPTPDADPDTGTEADASDSTDAGVAPEPPADDDAADTVAEDEPAGTDPEPGDDRTVDPGPVAGHDTETGVDAGEATGVDADRDADTGEATGADTDADTDRDADTGERGGDPVERETAGESGAAGDAAVGDPATRRPAGDDTPTQPGSITDDDGEPAGPTAHDTGRASPEPPDSGASGSDPGGGVGAGGGDSALTDEQRWQQARSIPSLDPAASTGGGEDGAEDGGEQDTARERTAQMQRQRRRRRAARDQTGPDTARDSTAHSGTGSGPRADRDEIKTLQKRLSDAKDRIESLEAERDDLLAEREKLAEERDRLRSEQSERAERIDALEAERDRLRDEVDRLQSRVDTDENGTAPSESMPPDRALSGTNLFVRYDSKGQATLKHAHSGEASRSDVRENLRLEHHTTFETDGVAVDDRPYEEFLRDSTEYAFARWVVSDLLYEIGETGNRSGLAGVFDAIPDIDRIELRGEVGVETDDGVESRAFDVVFRDRMGDPLFVADINPSRDATTEAMVGSLVENTHTVANEAETVGAGFYVTESFYEPGALETVADRTGGGILSRSNKRSFVKLSRKQGYHLCLVEARDGEFHLNVPEL